jgi:hypothetical protein
MICHGGKCSATAGGQLAQLSIASTDNLSGKHPITCHF